VAKRKPAKRPTKAQLRNARGVRITTKYDAKGNVLSRKTTILPGRKQKAGGKPTTSIQRLIKLRTLSGKVNARARVTDITPELITLSNGCVYQIDPGGMTDVVSWLPTDRITVRGSIVSPEFINHTQGGASVSGIISNAPPDFRRKT
jgi:hypothetical protein